MKKLGFLFFIAALAIGVISAVNCSVGNFNLKNMSGVQGSGNAKQETRNVSGFKEIEASGAINTEIAVGKDFIVTVEADDNLLPQVKTEVKGETLKIYTENRFSSKTKITVRISMPELKKVDISGASTANITNVTGDSLEMQASGASRIKVDGQVKDFNVEASGASTIDASKLNAENADVDSNGASTITVAPSSDLKAEASGASTVYYTGDPKNIKQDSSGASTIKKK